MQAVPADQSNQPARERKLLFSAVQNESGNYLVTNSAQVSKITAAMEGQGKKTLKLTPGKYSCTVGGGDPQALDVFEVKRSGENLEIISVNGRKLHVEENKAEDATLSASTLKFPLRLGERTHFYKIPASPAMEELLKNACATVTYNPPTIEKDPSVAKIPYMSRATVTLLNGIGQRSVPAFPDVPRTTPLHVVEHVIKTIENDAIWRDRRAIIHFLSSIHDPEGVLTELIEKMKPLDTGKPAFKRVPVKKAAVTEKKESKAESDPKKK